MDVTEVKFGEEENTMFDVWIQIHNLPLYLLSEVGGRKVMTKVGEVTGFDPRILLGERGNFVRICIRLQGSKPLRRGGYIVALGERIWLDYIYEENPWVCEWCGRFVHNLVMCAEEKRGRETESEAGYGPWMLDRPKWKSRKTPSADGNDNQLKTDEGEPLAAVLEVGSENGKKMVVISNPPTHEVLLMSPVDKSIDKGERMPVENPKATVVPQPKRMVEFAICLLPQHKQTTRRWEFKGWDPRQPYLKGNTSPLIPKVITITNVGEKGWRGLLKWEQWLLLKSTFFDESSNREEDFARGAQTLNHWAFKVWDPGRPKAEEVRGYFGLLVWVLWLLRKATFYDGSPMWRDIFARSERIMWVDCGTRKLGREDDTKPLFEDVQRKQMGVGPEDILVGWDSLLECVGIAYNFEDTFENWIRREVFSTAHQVARNTRDFGFSDQWFGRVLNWLDNKFLNDVMVSDCF